MPKNFHQAFVRLRSKSDDGQWLVHPDLRNRLLADAEGRETSLTDLVTRILADHFGVPYETAGRRSNPSQGEEDILNMRLPITVWRTVSSVAMMSDRRPNDVIREVLCTHYGLALPAAAAA